MTKWECDIGDIDLSDILRSHFVGYLALASPHRCTAPQASTTLRAGSSRIFRYDRDFHSMIFGGEILKNCHGVGCEWWPFLEVSEVV